MGVFLRRTGRENHTGLAVAIAGTAATSVAGFMPGRAGFAAVVFSIFGNVVARRNFAFAIRTGAFGISWCAHGDNI